MKENELFDGEEKNGRDWERGCSYWYDSTSLREEQSMA